MIGMQVAERDEQFHAGRIATVALAPFVDALVDDAAKIPVVAQLHETLVQQQDAVVAEVEGRKGRLVAVGLVLTQNGGVRVFGVSTYGPDLGLRITEGLGLVAVT